MKKIILVCLSLLLSTFLVSCASDGAMPADSEGSDFPEALTAELDDLSFDMFLDASYRILTSRTPELVTELGLDKAWGLDGTDLNNMSSTYLENTAVVQKEILELLFQYSPDDLSGRQLESRNILEWYLTDQLKARKWALNSFQVNHFIIGEPANTELFFTDVQPVGSIAEAENYITRLEKIETKMTQLADGILQRQDAGIILPSTSVRWTLGNLGEITATVGRGTSYYRNFEQKLAKLGLEKAQEDILLQRAAAACDESVIPGYRRLEEVLMKQISLADGNNGVWALPDGENYYKYTLAHHTTTAFTPGEIHEKGYQQLDRIHDEMKLLFEKIGIDVNQSISGMYRELDKIAETVPADEMVSGYSSILSDAEQAIKPLFNRFPDADVIVKGSDSGGFYLAASIDGSRPGMFFATESTGYRYKMPTLTFHETIPGHHFQIALANEMHLSPFQKGSSFLGYTEGWALYAERLMSDLGYYDNDEQGDLGRLQAEAFRAARLVIDTGIHHYKWDFNRAVDFFTENTGFSKGMAQWEVLRYMVWPGQSAAYMTGQLKLLELRNIYMEMKGDDYDIREFHTLILEQGAAPLDLLEKRIMGGV